MLEVLTFSVGPTARGSPSPLYFKDGDINSLKSCGYFSRQRERISKLQAKTYLTIEHMSDFPILLRCGQTPKGQSRRRCSVRGRELIIDRSQSNRQRL
jgi:hypothetical protein